MCMLLFKSLKLLTCSYMSCFWFVESHEAYKDRGSETYVALTNTIVRQTKRSQDAPKLNAKESMHKLCGASSATRLADTQAWINTRMHSVELNHHLKPYMYCWMFSLVGILRCWSGEVLVKDYVNTLSRVIQEVWIHFVCLIIAVWNVQSSPHFKVSCYVCKICVKWGFQKDDWCINSSLFADWVSCWELEVGSVSGVFCWSCKPSQDAQHVSQNLHKLSKHLKYVIQTMWLYGIVDFGCDTGLRSV